MKIREFFGLSDNETLPETNLSENASVAKESADPGETERKYTEELKNYQESTNEEIMRIESEFQEKIKTGSFSPEKFACLKEEKDRRQALLRENLIKVRMNLEEGLLNQWQTEDKEKD